MQADGKQPENVDSENPLVKLIRNALDAIKAGGDPSKQLEDMPQYRLAQQLAAHPSSSVDMTA